MIFSYNPNRDIYPVITTQITNIDLAKVQVKLDIFVSHFHLCAHTHRHTAIILYINMEDSCKEGAERVGGCVNSREAVEKTARCMHC